MIEVFESVLIKINEVAWGPVMPVALLFIGAYLLFGLRFMPWRYIGTGFRQAFHGRKAISEKGEVTPLRSLTTALSATVGSGNISGVAVAILIGGPGAIFWMWVTALFGMATKYAEAVLAVHYREIDANGNYTGGPMHYIKNGLSERWRVLAVLFALFGTIAGFGIGNMVQSNSVTDSVQYVLESMPTALHVPDWGIGIAMAAIIGFTIIGGVKRIAKLAARLVPLMMFIYISIGIAYIMMNITAVPEVLGLIIHSAFNGTAATGGFVGATVWAAIRFGVARGIFSNEAGLGSAPIAHAAAKTDSPVRQGVIAMLGTFIDTIIICTVSALVILLSNTWTMGNILDGVAIVNEAFESIFSGGSYVVTISLILFSFTTILGWSYYSERCFCYLFNVKYIILFRFLWVTAIVVGATVKLNFVWILSDTMNAFMALPNLIALLLLSPVVFNLTRKGLPLLRKP